jgi:hypothetical protein
LQLEDNKIVNLIWFPQVQWRMFRSFFSLLFWRLFSIKIFYQLSYFKQHFVLLAVCVYLQYFKKEDNFLRKLTIITILWISSQVHILLPNHKCIEFTPGILAVGDLLLTNPLLCNGIEGGDNWNTLCLSICNFFMYAALSLSKSNQ